MVLEFFVVLCETKVSREGGVARENRFVRDGCFERESLGLGTERGFGRETNPDGLRERGARF